MITSDRHELRIIESANGVKADLDEPLISDAMEHPETLRTLLDFGLDPNEKGASDRTPLMVAARVDLVQAEILLAHGAVIDAGAGDAVTQTDCASDPLCMSEEAAAADTPERTALSYAVEPGSPSWSTCRSITAPTGPHATAPASVRGVRRAAPRRPGPVGQNRRDAEITFRRPPPNQPAANRSRCGRASGVRFCAAAVFSRMRLRRSAGKPNCTSATPRSNASEYQEIRSRSNRKQLIPSNSTGRPALSGSREA
jgi:hypothetical protein